MGTDPLWGRYWPANSFWHRRDPRTLLGTILVLFGFVLSMARLDRQVAVLVGVVFLYKSARFPLTAMLKNLRPIQGLLGFILLINLLFPIPAQIGKLEEWTWGSRVETSLFFTLRLLNIWLISLWLMMTVRVTSLINAICHVLLPLRRWIPVHEFALAMGVAIRFLPLLAEEGEEILLSQKARTPAKRRAISQEILIVIPLLVSSMRRAKEMAQAIDARGFKPGGAPTIWPVAKWSLFETGVLAVVIIITTAVGLYWGWV